MRVLIVEDDDAIADAARRRVSNARASRSTGSRPGRRARPRAAARSTSCCSTSACPTATASTCAASCARARTCRSSWSPRGRGGRPGRRARARRRRLHRQAVRLPRARRAHPRRHAPHPARATARRAPTATAASATLAIDRRTRRVVALDGTRGARSRPRSSTCSRSSPRTPGAVRSRQRAPRGGVGPALVRPDQDARRARRVAAQEARRPALDRDRARRRLPAARPGRADESEARGEAAAARSATSRSPSFVLLVLGIPLGVVVRELGRAPADQRPAARRVLARDPIAQPLATASASNRTRAPGSSARPLPRARPAAGS